ncbi:phosphatidylglycerophosphatase A [Thermanaeromonas sp. C210]|nr:phosphatidylglycerophosphatase A [Thermanaeromonas sp. C210]GFN22286.1 phosphatidylglycerophosphatase A [Thermanaeromonas sp. C210]
MSLPKALERQQCAFNLNLKYLTIEWLQRRGVTLEDIASLVYTVQKKYIPGLTHEYCLESVERVLEKREVQNAVFTGVSLDEMAEKGLFEEPLSGMLRHDDGLYGIDEVLALSIVNIYGSIGLTNFGYLDKVKPGIIGKINQKKGERVNTFLDDLVAAIAAAAAARIAHQARDNYQEPK